MYKLLFGTLALCLVFAINTSAHAFVRPSKCKGKPCYVVSEKSARKTVGILMQFDSMGNTVKALKEDKKALRKKVTTLEKKTNALSKQLGAKEKEVTILRKMKDGKQKSIIENPYFWIAVTGVLVLGTGIGLIIGGVAL